MKIIEALKKIKALQKKAEDLRKKIGECSAKMEYETPKYENQWEVVQGWVQAHHDVVMEIESLRERLARTNLETKVTIELGANQVTKSIHSWISRRRDLSHLDFLGWKALSDRGLTDQQTHNSQGGIVTFKVQRFFDPAARDAKLSDLMEEQSIIDGKLEIVNAVTDLLD